MSRANRSRRIARAGAVALAIAAGIAALASAARAAEAPADTALGRYLGGFRDSTDAYFGIAAQPADTAGLDSALAAALANPRAPHSRARPRLSFEPWLAFNRVDGGTFGGRAYVGRRGGIGRLGGRLGWANGPDDVLGEVTYEKSLRRDEALWVLDLSAGRLTTGMDRDFGEIRLAQVRALLAGTDTKRYLRRDGFEAGLERETQVWRARVAFRDALESGLPVTATWNLAGAEPVVPDNLLAARGRVHEFSFSTTTRFGRLPMYGELDHATSGDGIGSDFEYRRTRVALAADLAWGRWLAIVPQASYGRLTGQLVPQAAYYLGGSRTLRTVEGSSLGGTGSALARLDLIETPDVLELLRIPHPAAFPLQVGLFGAAGAIWGRDPYGGPGTPEDDWPGREAWQGEAGVSLLYRPGLPDPNGFLRLSFGQPIGPDAGGMRFTLTFSRGIDLLRPLGE